MKKLILATALLASSMSQASLQTDLDRFCTALSNTAEAVMIARYDGLTLTQVKSISLNVANTNIYPYINAVIESTFQRPLMDSTKGKFDSINEASEETFYVCMELYGAKIAGLE